MSNLSELLPSGGGQNVRSFVASGTLSNGQTVSLKTDGKVEASIATSQASTGEGTFAAVNIWDGNNVLTISSVYDINANRVVQFYADSSNTQYCTGVVSTPTASGLTSFGTPVVINTADSDFITAVYHVAAQKSVVAYRDGGASNYGKCHVITVNPSNNSLTFGAEGSLISDSTYGISGTYDSTNEKVVFAMQNANGNSGNVVVGTISGTSITFGNTQSFGETGGAGQVARHTSCVYDSNSNTVTIFYSRNDQSNKLYATVSQVSGTTLNMGSDILVDNSFGVQNANITSVADTNSNKIVVFYASATNGNGYGVVGTPSYPSATFGTPVRYNPSVSVTDSLSSAFDSTENKIVVMYRNSTGDQPHVSAGTVNGTSITFATGFQLTTTKGVCNSLIFVSPINKFVASFRDGASPYYGKYILYNTASNNTSNFIGITGQAISDTATGNVDMLGGINSQQTSLVIGSKYYVQSDGTLGTTVTSTFAGQAVSATTLNIRDLT